MKKQTIFQAASFFINVLLITSVLVTLFGVSWEYSTRRYLAGFANAVLPYSTSPEKKVTAILGWMEHGPARETENSDDDNDDEAEARDPIDTLNYRELLSVCGTGTNAFVNLASAGGMEARRLLLLDERGMSTNHVVAEVYMDGRWVIVDPSFHAILKDSKGHFLTRQDLARTAVLRDATRDIANYDPNYNYEHTTFIHLSRVPLVGRFFQATLDSLPSSWQESLNWTMLLERQSYSTLIVGFALLCLALCLRSLICCYGSREFRVIPKGPWEQLRQGGVALFAPSALGKSEGKLPTA